MKFPDLAEQTYWALSGNKVRSGLTMLGIVIGIGSVITMVSVGQGAQQSIQSSIASIGSNLVIVTPGAQRSAGTAVSAGRGTAQTLTVADSDAISSSVSDAKAVAPAVSGRFQVTAKGTNTNTQVTGTLATYPEVRNLTIGSGVFFTDQQSKTMARVAVLGPTTRDDLFGTGGNAIGQTIRINNVSFKVIGITESKGGSGATNTDDAIYVPLLTAQRLLIGDSTHVSSVSIEATDQSAMSSVQQEVTALLLQRHQISDATSADFSVLTQSDIVSTASSVTGTFTVLLAAIASISLLVGGIGIMNMMLTTVTERTREIGLRKAIGAKRAEISLQFLVEAIMLTFAGGVIGIVLGWLLALLITAFANIQTSVTLYSVLLAFGVSAAVGVVFGYYPAQRAAKLNPIEALRYE